MLRHDPAERISLEQIKQHPWFTPSMPAGWVGGCTRGARLRAAQNTNGSACTLSRVAPPPPPTRCCCPCCCRLMEMNDHYLQHASDIPEHVS